MTVVTVDILIIGVALSGALASDQTPRCQSSSLSHDTKLCSDERTSLLQTASVVQKRIVAGTSSQHTQSIAIAHVVEDRMQSARATPTQQDKMTDLTNSMQQEASVQVSSDSSKLADLLDDTSLSAPSPPWFALLGKVMICIGAGALALLVLMVLCGQTQSLLSTPKYMSAQEQEDIKNGWVVYLILLSVCGLGLFTTDQYLPSLTKMQVDFGTTPVIMSLTLQVNWFALSVSSMLMAASGDVLGRKAILVFASFVTVAASLGCASATSVGGFVAARVLQGVASGCQTIVVVIIRDLFDDKIERMAFTSSIFIVLILCPTAAPAVGGFVASATSWRIPFIALAGWGFMNMLLVASFMPETRSNRTAGRTVDEYRSELSRFASDRHIMVLGICQGLCMTTMCSVDANFSQVLGAVFHQSQVSISWKLAVNTCSMLVPIALLESCSDGAGVCSLTQRCFGLAVLPIVACFVVGSTLSSWPALMACVNVSQLSMIAAYMGVTSLYFKNVKDASGVAIASKSLEMLISSVGSLVGSIVIKNSPNEVQAALFWIAGSSLVATVTFWLGFGHSPPAWAFEEDTEKPKLDEVDTVQSPSTFADTKLAQSVHVGDGCSQDEPPEEPRTKH